MRSRSASRAGVLVALVMACIVTPWAAAAPDRPIHGTLTEIDGLRVLRLWGTPAEQGYAQGYLLADDIVTIWNACMDIRLLGEPQVYESRVLTSLRIMKIPKDKEEELRGILAGITERLGDRAVMRDLHRPLKYEDLLAANCVADLAQVGCSAFAAWGPLTADGQTIAGRNLDWFRVAPLSGTQIVVVRRPDRDADRLGWVGITWPGLIGCGTGMNEEGVTIHMHDALGRPPSLPSGFTPRFFTYRDALETARAATAVDDITRLIRDRLTLAGNLMVMTRPYVQGAPAAVVFEFDGDRDTERGLSVRAPDDGQPSLVCTNHYIRRRAPTACARYTKLQAALRDRESAGEPLTVDRAWELLRSVETSGLQTHHSVVFEPNKRLMHVALAQDGQQAPECRRVTLNVAALLKDEPASGTAGTAEAHTSDPQE